MRHGDAAFAFALERLPNPGPSESVLADLSREHLELAVAYWKREHAAQFNALGLPERLEAACAKFDT